ncbi:MAG: hypothetical protein JO321_06100 [Solirubrobacterales bacterium]|nr:hypothetical protein [Solirubrobacterales bacterium]MBV9164625.1 hypothetical protein [Solirubrobacterales bacterium]MBV9534971.1 hypothetical protein [Solirubrobacterales bacterium]
MADRPRPSEKTCKVLGHALVDSKLRKKLLKDVSIANTEYGYELTKKELGELGKMVNKVTRDEIEELAGKCHEYAVAKGFCPR